MAVRARSISSSRTMPLAHDVSPSAISSSQTSEASGDQSLESAPDDWAEAAYAADHSCAMSASEDDQTLRCSLYVSSGNASSSNPQTIHASLTRRSRSAGDISPGSDQHITFAQLARHNTESDCWLAVKGKVCCLRQRLYFLHSLSFFLLVSVPWQVYDVTGWTSLHPGGQIITMYAGKDATDVFASFHAASSWAHLKQFCVGKLVVGLASKVLVGAAVQQFELRAKLCLFLG